MARRKENLNTEISETGEKDKKNWVNIRTERGGSEIFVGVNGTGYLIPPGSTTLVPPEVAAEFERAERAKDSFFSEARELQK